MAEEAEQKSSQQGGDDSIIVQESQMYNTIDAPNAVNSRASKFGFAVDAMKKQAQQD